MNMLATWYFFFLKFIFPFVFESRDDLFANARSFFFFRFFSLSLPFSFSRRFFREGGGEARASKEKKRGSVALCSQSNAQVARLPVFPPLNRRKEISSSKKEIERIPRKFKIFLPFISSSSVEMK